MAAAGHAGDGAGDGIMGLLHLVGVRPSEAMAQARAILAGRPAPYEASVAHQAIGFVLRDFGDLDAAIGELRAALRLARAARSPARRADVLATLGPALVHQGHSVQGLAALDTSLSLVAGPAAGKVLVRRGIALWVLGRHAEALDDLGRALRLLRPAADTIWPARALTARALVHLACGHARRAVADLDRAERLFASTNQALEVAFTWHNRGLVASRSGDIPLALSYYEEAGRRYGQLAVPMPELSIHRCAVLLAAALPADALREAEAGVSGFPRGGKPTMKAELLLAAAQAALAAGEPQVAAARAKAARAMFVAQGRDWWQAHAGLLLLQARAAAEPATRRLLGRAGQVAGTLERLGSGDAPQARLLAGRLALALGDAGEAGRQFALAARVRHHRVPALVRVHAWLAEALRRDSGGDRRGLLAACRSGFDVLDEHMLTLGASELRAQATRQGAELATLAQRAALRSGRPRQLLAWSERGRSAAQAIPPTRPLDDDGLQADLTALRDVTGRLERARADGDRVFALQREQLRLEARVRARVLRTRGGSAARRDKLDVARLLAELGELGDARLLQIADVDGALHLLVCGQGRVRRLPAGRAASAAREVDYARFALRRLAHALGAGSPAAALQALEVSGQRLEALLLGAAAGHLGEGPVIVVPPGSLHAVPWALLPSLRHRAVGVAPSAGAWLRARAMGPPGPGRPVLVRGPGLGEGGGEVPALARDYPGATVLCSGTATAGRVLAALDGAPLAHIAAHGTFRADSPLFSSLRLDDGQLTVHDLERLGRAPHRMILSSCDSGVLAPAGADELLGLTTALAPLGTAGIIASVGPVNDHASVGLMLALHRRLRRGAGLAEALRAVRAGVGADPVAAATAWSFIALGAS